jgi:hypothetical protein
VITSAHDSSAIDDTTTTTNTDREATAANAVADTATDDDVVAEVQPVDVDSGDTPSVEDDLPPG